MNSRSTYVLSANFHIFFLLTEVVAVLVDEEKEIIRTPKYIVDAAMNGCKEIVEILLEAGMDPNSFDSDSGRKL